MIVTSAPMSSCVAMSNVRFVLGCASLSQSLVNGILVNQHTIQIPSQRAEQMLCVSSRIPDQYALQVAYIA